MKLSLSGLINRFHSAQLRKRRLKHTDAEFLAAIDQGDDLDLPLAYALLLVDLASVDHNFDDQEHNVIIARLKKNFSVGDDDATDLIHKAETMLHPFRGAVGYTDQLRRELSLEDREKLMAMLDEVIAADNVEDGLEKYLRMRFAQMLDLTPDKAANES